MCNRKADCDLGRRRRFPDPKPRVRVAVACMWLKKGLILGRQQGRGHNPSGCITQPMPWLVCRNLQGSPWLLTKRLKNRKNTFHELQFEGLEFLPESVNLEGTEPPHCDFCCFLMCRWTYTLKLHSSLFQTITTGAETQVSYWREAGGTW